MLLKSISNTATPLYMGYTFPFIEFVHVQIVYNVPKVGTLMSKMTCFNPCQMFHQLVGIWYWWQIIVFVEWLTDIQRHLLSLFFFGPNHCQMFSHHHKPEQNLHSSFIEWSCAVITFPNLNPIYYNSIPK